MIGALAWLVSGAWAGDYAGAAACKGCHAAEYEAQSATAHAKALAWSKQGQPGDWAFGAGLQAITFVSRVDSAYYREEEQSWYTKLKRFARTPGHAQAGGVRYRIFDPEAAILRCFSCHSTGGVIVSEEGAILPGENGVRCEDCHGAAAEHVRDPAKVKPVQPGRMDGVALNELCGTCHRAPSGAPAADLNDPWNARHQPLMLAASRCFRESKGKLSCLSCHAAHQPLETKMAAYDAACARCHASPRHTKAVKGTACATCHMPAVKPNEGLSFANHRIAIYRAGASTR